MNVLHINEHYASVGGTETYLLGLLQAQELSGVRAIVAHGTAATSPESERPAYHIAGIDKFTLRAARNVLRQLTEVLERERPDVIHLHNAGNTHVAEMCRAFAPTVQSVHTHSCYCPGGTKRLWAQGKVCDKPLGWGCVVAAYTSRCNSVRPHVVTISVARSMAMMASLRRLPAVIAFSSYVRDRLVQNGVDPERVNLLPYFPSTSGLEGAPRTSEATDTGMILFSGRIVRDKGLEYLLRAFTIVPDTYRLVVNGDGLRLPQMRALATALGIERRVNFAGWQDENQQAEAYRKAAVVVVPSVWPEPFGIVGIEAMSFGKPVVASRTGGIADWLEDGRTGILVEPGDVTALARGLMAVLGDPQRAAEMGRRGREVVQARFTKDRHLTGLTKIYESAMERWGKTTQREAGTG